MEHADFTPTKLAQLARIALTPEEQAEFERQLPAIVDYISQLGEQSVPTEPEVDGFVLKPRADVVIPSDTRSAILDQAPQRRDDFWQVPSVF